MVLECIWLNAVLADAVAVVILYGSIVIKTHRNSKDVQI